MFGITKEPANDKVDISPSTLVKNEPVAFKKEMEHSSFSRDCEASLSDCPATYIKVEVLNDAPLSEDEGSVGPGSLDTAAVTKHELDIGSTELQRPDMKFTSQQVKEEMPQGQELPVLEGEEFTQQPDNDLLLRISPGSLPQKVRGPMSPHIQRVETVSQSAHTGASMESRRVERDRVAERVSGRQQELLLQYMETHRPLAKNNVHQLGSGGNEKARMLWDKLAARLNSVGNGSKKSGERWRKYWTDWKCKVRSKQAENRRLRMKTGGGPCKRPKLTDYDLIIIKILGKEHAEGDEELRYGAPLQNAPPHRSSPSFESQPPGRASLLTSWDNPGPSRAAVSPLQLWLPEVAAPSPSPPLTQEQFSAASSANTTRDQSRRQSHPPHHDVTLQPTPPYEDRPMTHPHRDVTLQRSPPDDRPMRQPHRDVTLQRSPPEEDRPMRQPHDDLNLHRSRPNGDRPRRQPHPDSTPHASPNPEHTRRKRRLDVEPEMRAWLRRTEERRVEAECKKAEAELKKAEAMAEQARVQGRLVGLLGDLVGVVREHLPQLSAAFTRIAAALERPVPRVD